MTLHVLRFVFTWHTSIMHMCDVVDFRFISQHSPNWLLGVVVSLSSAASPTPTTFSAMTRNTYSLPSNSLPTVYSKLFVSATGCHMRLMPSRFSTMNLLTSAPPSLSGGDQRRVTELAVMSFTDRFLGSPGLSVEKTQNKWLFREYYTELNEIPACLLTRTMF